MILCVEDTELNQSLMWVFVRTTEAQDSRVENGTRPEDESVWEFTDQSVNHNDGIILRCMHVSVCEQTNKIIEYEGQD